MDFQKINLYTILIRIGLAVIIGGIIGIERNSKAQAAGFRTYILVCLGATMVMMTNQYVTELYKLGDPTRMGAQVISGIGFIGAGAIIVTNNHRIKGLTTAAGLWAAAGIGLAIGIGFYEGAIACAFALILIMTLFQHFKRYIRKITPYVEFYAVFKSAHDYNQFLFYCGDHGIQINEIINGVESEMMYKLTNECEVGCFVSVKNSTPGGYTAFIKELKEIKGVVYIEEVKN